jgi:hypothetical protein
VCLAVIGLFAVASAAQAAPPDDSVPTGDSVPDESIPPDPQGDVTGGNTGGATPDTLPLIPVPTGCTAPQMPHIVFVGEVVARDYRTVRFEIERIRSGRADPFELDSRIDVRYGIDAQYLSDGTSYLVSAVVDRDLGILVSRVTEPIENFGGDEVIGVSETDVNCPDYEDPMRTLHLDGTPVDASVLKPFFDARIRILSAFLIPAALAIGAIFLLATFRLSVAGLYHTVAVSGRRRFN